MNARLNIRELDRIRVDIGTALQTEDELAETAPQRSQAHRVDGCSHPPERPGGTPRRYLADGFRKVDNPFTVRGRGAPSSEIGRAMTVSIKRFVIDRRFWPHVTAPAHP
jgi:hypothetical protein